MLWFDTEDYILPEADDAALRLCQFLSGEEIRATFKIVGEKARVLESRGRKDVLDAFSKHEIGYHTNFHSVQPTPAMYLSKLGWYEGVEEFDRREGQGLLDVERITGQRPTCYGQPGTSWGPQQFGGLNRWGVPLYLDAGEHISLDRKPYWYGGVLTIFDIKHTLRTELEAPEDLKEAKSEFELAYKELQSDGGLVSIYYHPCEFVHAEFWDAVNFLAGANPPEEEWKIPPMKSKDEIETGFGNFESYIRFINSHAQVEFITASQAVDLYRDRARGRLFQTTELEELARGLVAQGVVHQTLGNVTVSPSEQLILLSRLATQLLLVKEATAVRLKDTPLGPVRAAPLHKTIRSTRSQVERTVVDVADYVERNQRVPDAVWLGESAVSPESYLIALAGVLGRLSRGEQMPESVDFHPASLKSAEYVRNDRDLWSWIIFPKDFEAPEMMDLAKRQAWTLKPAKRAETGL